MVDPSVGGYASAAKTKITENLKISFQGAK
jgi:hypothetical protein